MIDRPGYPPQPETVQRDWKGLGRKTRKFILDPRFLLLAVTWGVIALTGGDKEAEAAARAEMIRVFAEKIVEEIGTQEDFQTAQPMAAIPAPQNNDMVHDALEDMRAELVRLSELNARLQGDLRQETQLRVDGAAEMERLQADNERLRLRLAQADSDSAEFDEAVNAAVIQATREVREDYEDELAGLVTFTRDEWADYRSDLVGLCARSEGG